MTCGALGPDSAATPGRWYPLWFVKTRLGDDERAGHAVVELAQDVARARVVDRVDRVEAQAVDGEIVHPALSALQHPLAHRVGPLVVVVDGVAPERRVLVGEVRAE